MTSTSAVVISSGVDPCSGPNARLSERDSGHSKADAA